MDTANVGRGTLIAGVSGVLLFIFMFFSWFGVDVSDVVPAGVPEDIANQAVEQSGVDTTATAWQAFDVIDLVLLVAVIIAVGFALIDMTGAAVSLPVAGSALTAGIGAIAFLLVLYRLIDPPGGDGVGREIGVWLGLITTAGIAYGGYLGMQEEGTSFGDVRDQVAGGPPDQPPRPPDQPLR
jgi:hypothetical protein